MRLAISNIAWLPRERDAILALLAEHGVEGIEIAAGLAFPNEPDAFAPSSSAIAELRRACDALMLKIVSMQSLLFGVQGAKLFGSDVESARFGAGIDRAIRLAARLAIPNLVLGSPLQRSIPVELPRESAEVRAAAIFRSLGDACTAAGTKLALEPNHSSYGTNFLTTTQETFDFVRKVDHPAVKVNFDIGAALMNDEIPGALAIFAERPDLVSHVHVSEPQLAHAPRDPVQLASSARQILNSGYEGWFSIEMRPTGEDNRQHVRSAVEACSTALGAAFAAEGRS